MLDPSIKHSPSCVTHSAPPADYVSDDDCDCGASVQHLKARIAELEAALAIADDKMTAESSERIDRLTLLLRRADARVDWDTVDGLGRRFSE